MQSTFTQFLPLYLRTERYYTLGAASLTLFVYLAGGALGALAGGSLADRVGGRLVILTSMIGSVPVPSHVCVQSQLVVGGRAFYPWAHSAFHNAS